MRSTTKLFGFLFIAAAAGCATPVPYTADEGLVAKSSLEETRNKTREVLLRSAPPNQVSSVDFTDDHMTVRTTQVHMGAWYQTYNTQTERQLLFANLGRYEVYDNHYVFLYDLNNALLLQVLFRTPQDARSFADHLWSLRAHRAAKK